MRILSLPPAVLAAPLLGASCGLVHLPSDCPSARTGCPCEPPTLGDSCEVVFSGVAMCSYGTEQLPGCRQTFSCVHGEWQIFDPLLVGGCPKAGECPATRPADGDACTLMKPEVCGFEDGTLCTCILPGWSCFKPTPTPGCPDSLPNAGTPCSVQLICGYSNVGPLPANAQCNGEVWQWQVGGC